MALEYRLTLSSETPVDQVAQRAFPDPAERPKGTPPLLSADLYDRFGFEVSMRAGRNGYVDVESDDGSWEWEPDAYVSATFRMDKFADESWTVTNMLTIVRRVLDTGPEDAAFVFNGDILLFTRFGGVVRKHRRETWWSGEPTAGGLIPG